MTHLNNTLSPLGWKVGRLDDVWNDMDRVVGAFLGADRDRTVDWAPRMDLSETESHFTLQVDLPGISENDLEIEFHEGVLTISGAREDTPDEANRTWHRVERRRGIFRRAIRLGDEVEADGIEAEFTGGVLSILVPKAEEARPHRISLKTPKS